MNPNRTGQPAPADGHPDLAALVRAAGGYVRPSDSLRPRTLEAAREYRATVRRRRRLASVGLAAATLWWAATMRPAGEAESQVPPLATADVWQLGESAQQQAVQAAAGPTWALADVFDALRVRQSELIAPPAAP
jgi:hypothetical protein